MGKSTYTETHNSERIITAACVSFMHLQLYCFGSISHSSLASFPAAALEKKGQALSSLLQQATVSEHSCCIDFIIWSYLNFCLQGAKREFSVDSGDEIQWILYTCYTPEAPQLPNTLTFCCAIRMTDYLLNIITQIGCLSLSEQQPVQAFSIRDGSPAKLCSSKHAV